jgi:outer membrane immunogenic protein
MSQSFALVASVVFAALLAGNPVVAADLPVKARPYEALPAPLSYNWAGFYFGGHVGYLWGRTRVEENGELTEPHAKTNGVIGGVLGGYNFQTGPWVFGAEADIGWSNAHGTGICETCPPPPAVTELPNTYHIKWTSHVRGRFGYAFDRWLLFVAGGLAVADFKFIEGGETSSQTQGAKFVGGSIGGGVEYAFTDLIRGRLEYLYDDLGHKTYINADGDIYRVGLTGQTFRGALVVKLAQ